MTTRKSLDFSLAALMIVAPGLASASSLYHPTGGEVGYTTHPDHVQSTKSRGEVMQSVEAARKDGTLAVLSRCLLYTSPSPRDLSTSRMPSSA